MINGIIDLIAPDYCCGCGKVGAILCESCFYDIISEPFNRCPACLKPTGVSHRCTYCRLPYERAWIVGWRQDGLERLVDISKFDSVRRACLTQAKLLDATLPQLPSRCVVVPIPTTRPHIRRRGFGHAELIAKQLAKLRQLPYREVLQRRQHTVQHGANRSARQKQAKQAYQTNQQPLDSETTYLLVDDVFTTGATVRAASDVLRAAGAENVWLAITTRQPLD